MLIRPRKTFIGQTSQKLAAFLVFFACAVQVGWTQDFTRQDTLRGTVTSERIWWDLNYYDLAVEIDPTQKFIRGSNVIGFTPLEKGNKRMQIDLQPPMQIKRVQWQGRELSFSSEGNAHFIEFPKNLKKGKYDEITVHYEGNPREAVRAPWDGGFSWKKDGNGKPFVATSCQGLGASVWWPNKDHMYDEVDSMAIRLTVPKDLVGVANGRLTKTEKKGNQTTYHWFVTNPINNYGVNANVGDYVHFGEVYQGEKGPLDIDYYVLRENLDKAKEQFKQVPLMMDAFEHWFGPYPFYEDSFKLVEVPYLGMEHQSSVTYGNKYLNGYLGNDLSGSGWGLKFDFIIIHEAGHEWFANNITYKDAADMWVHEGFTAYSENLFLDYHYGKEASSAYVIGTRRNIRNDRSVIGVYGVNFPGSGDMYYKGANLLHTLRQLIEDDELWRDILRGLNKEFYHQTVTTKQIEDYISKRSGKDLTAFFDQYLRTKKIPFLEYRLNNGALEFRYQNVVDNFDMPIKAKLGDQWQWILPTTNWKSVKNNVNSVEFDQNFYVKTKEVD